jgi:GTP-binding protein YchF
LLKVLRFSLALTNEEKARWARCYHVTCISEETNTPVLRALRTRSIAVSLSIGIVGLPNVGKSTLFTALTNKGGLAANYPFATIEPNVGVVPVHDSRLDRLAEIDHPARIVPATVEFVDIAGLVAGASQGEGLGNQFLAHIRETDAICEVVRFFKDPDVVHVDGRVDPQSDVETIKTELILADLGTLEKAMGRLEKEAKRDKSLKLRLDTAKKVEQGLNEGHRAARLGLTDEEVDSIKELQLLTMKPMLYVANVDEDMLTADLPEIDGTQPVPICAQVEAELAELDPAEAKEYLAELGLEESGLARLVREAYKLLGLQSFFTSGETESRAWTVPIGAKAPQAAGVIHSDFERGFIKAETASFQDYSDLGGEKGCRDAGKLRQEGKDYVVQDGDVMHFKFNV